MKIMRCPLNGPRNISEFACLGECKLPPAPEAGTQAWSEYVFLETNPAGLIRELWVHIPTNYVFVAERNTLNEEILQTFPLSAFAAQIGSPESEGDSR